MHMKATDLNRALNYVDDAYLMEADTPYKVIETESKEIKPMKTQKRAFRILLAAALIGVLSITAYAAEMLPIHKLESGKTKHYESYSDVDRAIAQVGLEVSVPEEFENGFRFQGVDVGQTIGKDARTKRFLPTGSSAFPRESPGSGADAPHKSGHEGGFRNREHSVHQQNGRYDRGKILSGSL